MHTFKRLLPLLATLYTYPGHASPWPWAAGMTVQCNNGAPNCNTELTYSWSGVTMVDAPDNTPSSYRSTEVRIYGIHCSRGSVAGEFGYCVFTSPASEYGHAPALTGPCSTTTPDGWELTPGSTCELQTGPVPSRHTGAYIGAECAVYAKGPTGVVSSVSTPWGSLSAEQVANSYSAYCSKPPLPNQECRISLPADGVIDHGIMPPNGSGTRIIRADVTCGDDALVSVMGGGVVELGPGVTSRVSAGPVMAGSSDIMSVLTLTDAEPGPHSGILIVTVSPR